MTSQSDIIDGQSYVMCDNRAFRKMPYGAYGLNPAWRRTIKPDRTNDGRIVGFGDGHNAKVERPKSVRPGSPFFFNSLHLFCHKFLTQNFKLNIIFFYLNCLFLFKISTE